MSLFALRCPIRNYDWGSPTVLPELLGRENPEQRPWAEMWIGAHSSDPAVLPDGRPLHEHIAQDPRRSLGNQPSLPFLLKLLAIERPLSLQCHPNLVQAQEGFARENAAGINIGARERNYRDANHKPELVVALGEFWALYGFRTLEDNDKLLAQAGLKHKDCPDWKDSIAGRFRQLLEMRRDPQRCAIFLKRFAAGIDSLPDDEAHWASEIMGLHASDPLSVAPLFFQLVKLEAGQALFLDAGELHAYLRGSAVEIMANSDNVLRGGLTSKNVNIPELLSVANTEPSVGGDGILFPSQDGVIARYPDLCSEFSLTSVALQSTDTLLTRSEFSLGVNLGDACCLQSGSMSLKLPRGGAYFHEAGGEPLVASGEGQLWVATAGAKS